MAEGSPWEQNGNTIWLASTLTLHRNVARHLFASKLEPQRQTQLFSLLSQAFLQVSTLDQPTLIDGKQAKPEEKQVLFEHFLFSDGLHEAAHHGEGFAFDKTGKLLAVFNLRDHLQLEWIDISQDLDEAFSHLAQIEGSLGKSFEWAWTPRFGFLTADPRLAGTGLCCRMFLHLPVLIHTKKLPERLKGQREIVDAVSLQGSPERFIADLVVLSNRYTLGTSEEDILKQMRLVALALQADERAARKEMQSDESLKDQAARAFGLLMHSLQLELIETLDAISLCKLAADQGWLQGTSQEVLNALFFDLQGGHLRTLEPEAAEQMGKKRAELVHQALASATYG